MKRVEYRPAPGAELQQVAPGVVFELPGIVTATDVDLGEGRFNVRILLDQTKEGIRPVEVLVQSQDGDQRAPVTGTTLRAVKVWELARIGLQGVAAKGSDFTDYVSPPGERGDRGIGADSGVPNLVELKREGPTGESLKWAAYYYNLASILGLPPLKAVAEALDLSPATAGRWVRKAREQGMIVDAPNQAE